MSDADRPEIGASADAGGIKANHLERSKDLNKLVGDFPADDGG